MNELHAFARKHANSRKSLGNWINVTESALWNSFSELRQTFNSADYLKDLAIFDVGGNNYRLVTSVDFENKRVYVLDVMTHAEYDRWKP
ncbi:MAG: type II toxin-antitoxin system HigB family toxin [Candidatus Obscuribacterales bacterium]